MCNDVQSETGEQLLGEIDTTVIRAPQCHATVAPREQVNFEREPEHAENPCAIRVENGRFEAIGYLPDDLAAWLAPLLDADKVRIEGYYTGGLSNDVACPEPSPSVVLSVFICGRALDPFQKPAAHHKRDRLHEVVRRAFFDAHQYTDPRQVLELAERLKPLIAQQLLPETRMLLALLPGIADEIRAVPWIRGLTKLHKGGGT